MMLVTDENQPHVRVLINVEVGGPVPDQSGRESWVNSASKKKAACAGRVAKTQHPQVHKGYEYSATMSTSLSSSKEPQPVDEQSPVVLADCTNPHISVGSPYVAASQSCQDHSLEGETAPTT